MRYRGMKDVYSIVAVMFFLLEVSAVIFVCAKWQDFDNGIRIFMVVLLCMPLAVLYFVFSRLRHQSCHADIREDGIHVFSKAARELAFIDWMDVTDHKNVIPDIDAPSVSYDLLIFQRAAPFGDKLITMLRTYRVADIEKIAKYRLDEQMQKLNEGTMTAEEFKNLPYLFLVADYEFGGKWFGNPTSKIERLWSARRQSVTQTTNNIVCK